VIPVVLLAGGLGTRLEAVSGGLPKPLVPVGDRPFIEYVLDAVSTAGLTELVMAVSFRWEALRNHFGETYRGMSIRYSVEAEPLGTGGAIWQGFRQCNLERALVLNADTLFRIDLTALIALHSSAGAAVTMALRRVPDTARYGAVECDETGRVTAFHEKGRSGPGLVNGGIYVVERSELAKTPWPAKFSFEQDFLQARLKDVRPVGYESDAYFIDIGVPEDLARARAELASDA
jgi:D-glycero-alpha-D-manno-heptose 1-phosphate guanylyltransferase